MGEKWEEAVKGIKKNCIAVIMESVTHLEQLAERIAADNDKEAYEQLFYQFYDKLLRFAISFLKQEEIAEEIVSDVFVNIWRNRTNLPAILNLQPYLYVATRNLCLRYLARVRKNSALSIHVINSEFLSSPYQTPEEKMLSSEMISKIENAIEKLPPQCRLIFVLIKENGLKYKEVAQVLNLSVKTVEAQMAIATKRIHSAVDIAFIHLKN